MSDSNVRCRVRNLTGSRRGIPTARRNEFVYVGPGQVSKEKEFRLSTLKCHQRWGVIEVIGTETKDAQGEARQKEALSFADLQQQARDLGVKVDGRWGEAKLKREIAAAKAAQS